MNEYVEKNTPHLFLFSKKNIFLTFILDSFRTCNLLMIFQHIFFFFQIKEQSIFLNLIFNFFFFLQTKKVCITIWLGLRWAALRFKIYSKIWSFQNLFNIHLYFLKKTNIYKKKVQVHSAKKRNQPTKFYPKRFHQNSLDYNMCL